MKTRIKKSKFWWWKEGAWTAAENRIEARIPLFSDGRIKTLRNYDFPTIFKKPVDWDNWFAAREQLWAIENKLVGRMG